MLKALIDKYPVINGHGKSNYHTHTFYCDGKDSPDEMAEAAFKLGLTNLGFSGHQYSEPDKDYAMNPESEVLYRRDIARLAEEYDGRMNIYLGIERDYFCEELSPYQYVIGSCHHVKVGDSKWLCVDESPEVLEKGVRDYFDGDYMALVRAYYEEEANVLSKTSGQIVGHFDLISKFNEKGRYFNEESEEYRAIALESCRRIIDSFIDARAWENLPEGFPEELGDAIEKAKMPIFEINLGAVGRWRSIPYPRDFVLDYLAERGVPLLISVDCHDRKKLVDISII